MIAPLCLSLNTAFEDDVTSETLAVLPTAHIPRATNIVRRGGKGACCRVPSGWYRYEQSTCNVLNYFLIVIGIDIENSRTDTFDSAKLARLEVPGIGPPLRKSDLPHEPVLPHATMISINIEQTE